MGSLFKTPEMPTKKDLGESSHTLSVLGIPPAAGAAKQERNNVEREEAVVNTNRRTNKAKIWIEGWEGVPVYKAEAFREIASLGGIVEELLRRTS